MKHPKDWLVITVLYWLFTAGLGIGCWWAWHAGEKYFTEAERGIQLIDGWSYMDGYKGHLTEKWRGEFIDLASGKHFELELTPQMFGQFTRGDRKPIDTTHTFDVFRFDEEMQTQHQRFAIARFITTFLFAFLVLCPFWRWINTDDGLDW